MTQFLLRKGDLLNYRRLIKTIEKDGWVLVRTNGCIHTYKKEGYSDIVTIHVHTLGKDVPKGLLHRYESITGLILD